MTATKSSLPRQVYGEGYDFEAALAEALTRRSRPDSAAPSSSHPVTQRRLDAHRLKFMPPDGPKYRDARDAHNRACDAVEAEHGLKASPKAQAERARSLYAEGWPVPDIAAEIKAAPGTVRKILQEAVSA